MTRQQRWWMHYDPATGPKSPRSPTSADTPELAVGDVVRLAARPDRDRRVIEVIWHSYRHRYAYIVETFNHPHTTVPYWFRDQLIVCPRDI
jgi:hypothetical protein